MREFIQQHPQLNLTQDDIVKTTLTKAERQLKDKSDGRPGKPPSYVYRQLRMNTHYCQSWAAGYLDSLSFNFRDCKRAILVCVCWYFQRVPMSLSFFNMDPASSVTCFGPWPLILSLCLSRNGYSMFCAELMSGMKDVPSTERMVMCSQRWKLLKQSDKDAYQKRCEQVREQLAEIHM